MAETKHTQGPWEHVNETWGDMILSQNGTGVVVFQTTEYGRPSSADARLMAAAPDLLAVVVGLAIRLSGPRRGRLETI